MDPSCHYHLVNTGHPKLPFSFEAVLCSRRASGYLRVKAMYRTPAEACEGAKAAITDPNVVHVYDCTMRHLNRFNNPEVVHYDKEKDAVL
jgi:hypothetical protein